MTAIAPSPRTLAAALLLPACILRPVPGDSTATTGDSLTTSAKAPNLHNRPATAHDHTSTITGTMLASAVACVGAAGALGGSTPNTA